MPPERKTKDTISDKTKTSVLSVSENHGKHTANSTGSSAGNHSGKKGSSGSSKTISAGRHTGTGKKSRRRAAAGRKSSYVAFFHGKNSNVGFFRRKNSNVGFFRRKNSRRVNSAALSRTEARRQEVRRIKILILAVSAIVLLLGIFLIVRLLTPVDKGSLVGVNDDVLQYQEEVEAACKEYGISQYSVLMLAMIQQESSGQGTDVLQCSESPFNTEYENSPNAITDVSYSISVGAETFAYCLKQAKCKSIKNMERVKIALQEYNFGNNYASWVLENYGSYSVENATEFSLMMQEQLGWDSYGDPEYAEHVLRYYTR